ncbi:MAG: hypothetical protein HUU29_12835, partial [Planctomycetaceae bacterium]|nr:hypothetical protein [Planctomycetaceae bacterium]
MRIALCSLLALCTIVSGVWPTPSAAQSTTEPAPKSNEEPPIAIGAERLRRLRLPREDVREPLNLAMRLTIESVEYLFTRIDVKVFVEWRDRGKYIPGIKLSAELLQRNELEKWQQTGTTRGEGVTSTEGYATVRLPLPGEELEHGEYAVTVTLTPALQSQDVRDAMMRDPELFGHKLVSEQKGYDEQGNKRMVESWVRITDDKDKHHYFNELVVGKMRVPSATCKLFIAGEQYYADLGTLNAGQQIENRKAVIATLESSIWTLQRKLPANMKEEERTAKIAKLEKDLALARAFLDLGGGELTQEEKDTIKRAQSKITAIRKEIASRDDPVMLAYLQLVHGDFKYWEWRIHQFVRTAVNYPLVTGKMPWMDPDLNLRDRDEDAWKRYLKQELEVEVNGDPMTWKENRGMMAPEGQEEKRGGNYTPTLLERMKKDIDGFVVEDFIVEQDDGSYRLHEGRWREFENDIAKELGMVDGSEPLKLKAYSSQAEAASTALRVRVLDQRSSKGLNRFPNAWQAADEILKALSGAPLACRYEWLSTVHKLSGKELDDALGTNFPPGCRESAGANKKRINARCDDITKRYFKFGGGTPIYAVWFYDEGYGRNRENREKELEKARKKIERR